MNLAPIVLFVYNRPEHTKRVLESLLRNKEAAHSTLYVYADGPKESDTPEQIKLIEAVRNTVKSKMWCSEVYLIEQSVNLGLAESVISGVTEIIDQYDSVIVLEDDILVSEYFLRYMNQALEMYKNDDKVFGISAYKYPSEQSNISSSYFLPIACSWGYATWKKSWDRINFKGDELFSDIKSKNLRQQLNFGNYKFYEMLESQVLGKIDSWAIRFYASMFLLNGIFLYPKKSLVQNIGFDNSGTHCYKDNFFSKNNLVNEELLPHKLEISLDPIIVAATEKAFLKQSIIDSPTTSNAEFMKRIILKGKKLYKRFLF